MSYSEVAPGLFAFWKYDLSPYLLGGEITHMNQHGDIYAKGYGLGYSFRPVKIMPLEQGLLLNNKLKTLEVECDEAINSVKNNFRDKLDIHLNINSIVI